MPARFHCYALILMICTALASPAFAATKAASPADAYLAMRKSLGVTQPPAFSLKNGLSSLAGKTVEVSGAVNGLVSSGDSTSFIIECANETLVVKAGANMPAAISNGNKVRALVTVNAGAGPGTEFLELRAAEYEYEVAQREKELAPKPQTRKAVAPKYKEDMTAFNASRMRNSALSSRAMEVFAPYRKAISQFNPKLTDQQLDTITATLLGYSDRYNVDPRLVVAIFIVESGFKPTATSRAGAMGIGQLMPGTASGLGVRNAYDPAQNIEASIRLISSHLETYNGDMTLALAAYNAGPGAVKKYGGVPPYRETKNYVRKITSIYNALCGRK